MNDAPPRENTETTPASGAAHKAGARRGGRVFAVAWLAYAAAAALLLWRAWTPRLLDRLVIGGPEGDFLRQFLPYRAFVAQTLASGRLPLWNPHQDAGTPALADPQLAVLYPWRLLQAPFALGDGSLSALALVIEAVAHIGLAGALTFGLLRSLGARPAAAFLGGLAFALSGYLTGYPLDQLAVLDSAAWLPGILWALVIATRAPRAGDRRRAALLAAGATALALLAGHPQTVSFGLVAGAAWLTVEAWRARRASRRVARMAGGTAAGRGPDAAAPAGAGVAAARGTSSAPPARAARMRALWTRAATPRSSLGIGLWWLLGAAGLAAAQWWPSWSFLGAASRELSRAELLAGLPPGDLLGLIAPNALSRWSPLYVGLPTVALAAWGAWRVPASRFWLALAGGGALWSLGGNGPLAPLVLRLTPALMPFRHQERAAVLVALGLAVAAGLAAEWLAASDGPGRQDEVEAGGRLPDAAGGAWREAAWLSGALAIGLALLGALALRGGIQPVPAGAGPWSWADATAHGALYAGAAALVLALAARGRLGPLARGEAGGRGGGAQRTHRAVGLLALVLAVDLLSANTGHALGPLPEGGPFAVDAGVQTLLERARDGRVSSEGRLPGGANAATMHGLFDVTGDSPLHLAPVQRWFDELPELVWWRLLGVRYLVSDRGLGEAEAALLRPLGAVAGDVPVYEVALPAPPVWTTPRTVCRFQRDPWAPGPDFDPLAGVVVTTDNAERAIAPLRTSFPTPASLSTQNFLEIDGPYPHACTTPEDEPVGAARLVGLDPGRAVVEAELPAGAWVVWSNAWDPGGGWRAKATSEEGEVVRPVVVPAYGALTAVWLPQGGWRIEWTYRPLSVILGGLISLLSCGLCLAAFRMGRSG